MTIEVAEMIDEFVWLLEDTADFIADRVLAVTHRYQAQLLPPYARVLADYARLREHSWSAPGHPGTNGTASTTSPMAGACSIRSR
jgi:arginine decarboxylase